MAIDLTNLLNKKDNPDNTALEDYGADYVLTSEEWIKTVQAIQLNLNSVKKVSYNNKEYLPDEEGLVSIIDTSEGDVILSIVTIVNEDGTPDIYSSKYSEYQEWRTQYKEAASEYFKNIDIPLIKAKNDKLKEIDKYDTSSAVNNFTFNGQSFWIDKSTRVGLVNSVTIEKSSGKKNTTLWFNNEEFIIPVDMALHMLSAIELYALECYNVTARHKAEVSKLEDIDSINNYDITVGYPLKLIL